MNQQEEHGAAVRRRWVDALEEERARIARELRDGVVQRLGVVSFRLHESKRTLHVSPTDSRRELEEARGEISKLAKDLLALAHRLYPAQLDLLGFAATAKALCREISTQRGIELTFKAQRIPEGLSKPITLCLYRVLQEALHNAAEHSGTRRIEVLLHCGVDQIELTVRDFGCGFHVETAKGLGLGLTVMNERLKAVRGRLAIKSQPQDGTTIHACVPPFEDGPDTRKRPDGA
jgi:signal transduction histidine kinase